LNVLGPLPPPPPPIVPVAAYLTCRMRLVEVNGSLTTLSEHQGFRNFVKAKADELGVTGRIQRYYHNDVLIEFEGTIQQVRELRQFLTRCQGQDMIQTFRDDILSPSDDLMFDNFKILKDFSRTVERRGNVKGEYSDGQFDKISEYSADSPFLIDAQVGDYL
jgi:acylphosphatase